jgi:hypothetical protein
VSLFGHGCRCFVAEGRFSRAALRSIGLTLGMGKADNHFGTADNRLAELLVPPAVSVSALAAGFLQKAPFLVGQLFFLAQNTSHKNVSGRKQL